MSVPVNRTLCSKGTPLEQESVHQCRRPQQVSNAEVFINQAKLVGWQEKVKGAVVGRLSAEKISLLQSSLEGRVTPASEASGITTLAGDASGRVTPASEASGRGTPASEASDITTLAGDASGSPALNEAQTSDGPCAEDFIRVSNSVRVVSSAVFTKKLFSLFKDALSDFCTPEQKRQCEDLKRASSHMQKKKEVKERMQEIYKSAFKENAVVLVEGMKSNKWVAELALWQGGDSLAYEPFAFRRLGSKNAQDFINWKNSSEYDEACIRQKSIVLFDDGSFSGKQMTDHVRAIKEAFSGVISKICVVVPYMTTKAKSNLEELDSEECPVIIHTSNIIPTLSDIGIRGERVAKFWGVSSDLGVLLFGFKAPNDLSFPSQLVSGAVPSEEKSVPFIDNCHNAPPYKRNV